MTKSNSNQLLTILFVAGISGAQASPALNKGAERRHFISHRRLPDEALALKEIGPDQTVGSWVAPRAACRHNLLVHTELAYMFRHAILRDVAYQLQLPGDRARLHQLAFEIIELVFAQSGEAALDAVSAELAEHAKAACEETGASTEPEARYRARAAHHAEVQYRNSEAIRHFDRLAEISEAKRFEALYRGSWLCYQSGAHAQARQRGERALAIARHAGDNVRIGKALHHLGSFELGGELRGSGEQLLLEAVAVLETTDNKSQLSAALNNLSVVYRGNWNDEPAMKYCRRALDLACECGHATMEAEARVNLAALHTRSGDFDKASAEAALAHDLFRKLGNSRRVAEAIVVDANNHFTQKHWNDAERGYRDALEIYRRTGDAHGVSRTLGNLASTISMARDSQDAIALYLEGVALAREIGAKGTLCTNQCNLADEYLKFGKLDEAEMAAREAVDVSRNGLNRRYQGRALACLAIVHFARRQDAVASSMWEEATRMLQAIGGAQDIEMLKELLDRTMAK